MKRLSLQWRITLMTALLIAGACICLNLLLYRSGASGMDNLNGYILQYQQDGGEDLTIEIPEDQMSDFLVQFSQEVYDTKTIFGRKGWCITAVVTLFSAAIAYFISGKALEPLKELAQQAEKVDQDNLVDVRLEENTVAEFRQLSQSVNQMLDRLAHSFDLQRQFAGNAAENTAGHHAGKTGNLRRRSHEYGRGNRRAGTLSDRADSPFIGACTDPAGNEQFAGRSAG